MSNASISRPSSSTAQRSYVSQTFTKTNEDTIDGITGLFHFVSTGPKVFRAILFYDADAVGGHRYAASAGLGLTVSNFITEITSLDNASGLYVINARQTIIGDTGAVGESSSTSGCTIIEGFFNADTAGFFTIGFGQNVATPATSSSILIGSNLIVDNAGTTL